MHPALALAADGTDLLVYSLMAFVVVGAVTIVAQIGVVTMGIVCLVRGKPSVGWGVANLAVAALELYPLYHHLARLDPFGHKKSSKQKWYSIRPLVFMRSLLCLSKGSHPHSTCPAQIRFDVWSHHPYTYGGPFGRAKLVDDVELGDLPKMRALLSAGVRLHHVVSTQPVQFWVTEFGWNTKPPRTRGVSLGLATRWTAESLHQMWLSGVSLVTWFLLQDYPNPSPFNSGLFFHSPAVATARPAYERYEKVIASERWQALAAAGANEQRPLWASTGVKDPAYDDTMYVVDLAAPNTVNTMPEATLDAVADHGVVKGDQVSGTYAAARGVLDQLEALGIGYDDVIELLEVEGVQKFEDSYAQLAESVQHQLDAAV